MRAASVGVRSELIAYTGTWMAGNTAARSSDRSERMLAIATAGGSSDMS